MEVTSTDLAALLIEKIHIKREHLTTFLGIFIDESLSYKQHIDIVSNKISEFIGILYKSRDALSINQEMY